MSDNATPNPFDKKEPGEGEKHCPYDGIAYSKVPGYISGYGCPECKAIGFYHLPVTDEWIVSQYRRREDLESFREGIYIELATSPFYEGERWAVRFNRMCLSVKGNWAHEPLPSSRTEAYYRRFRFTSLAAAKDAASKAAGRLGGTS